MTKLIWITPEAEKVIGYCARVSNPKNQDNPDVSRLLSYCIKHGHWSIFEMASMCVEIKTTRAIAPQILRHRSFSFQEFSQRYATVTEYPDVARLLSYCIKHGHWSIFEMASMCVEIKTTRAIAPQILRHRSFSFQEFSQRYATVTEYPDVPQFRLAGTTNRQSSIPIEDYAALPFSVWETINSACLAVNEAIDAYDALIKAGIAAETARMVLPLCTPTTMYMSGTIRSWIHYVQLRTQEDTQLEHRQIAESIKALMVEHLPITMGVIG